MRDRIVAAATAIDRLSTRRSEAKRARDFQGRAQALSKPAERLAALCQRLRLLRKHGVPVPLRTDTPRSLLGQAAEIQNRFAADAESIVTADPRRFATFWKPLEGYADQVESDLQQGWRAWVFAALPGGEQELLGVLDRFTSFREPVQVIRNGLAEAQQLASHLPASDEPFGTVARLAADMAKAWERLNGAHVSPEVLTFLKKAATREATLADYSPDVMNWVQENDLLRSFQIVLGGK